MEVLRAVIYFVIVVLMTMFIIGWTVMSIFLSVVQLRKCNFSYMRKYKNFIDKTTKSLG